MPSGATAQSIARLEDVVYAVAASGAMPVILGGDHTITFPDATGVARRRRSLAGDPSRPARRPESPLLEGRG